MRTCYILAFIFLAHICSAQDTAVVFEGAKVMLPEVIIRNNLDYKTILNQIKNDTTFYKAFRNLHVVEYSSYNNILIKDKKGDNLATYYSKTRQHRSNGCRATEVLEQKTTGDFFNPDSSYNYVTAEMFASLFFAKGSVCGENNIVAGHEFNPDNKSGMEKRKEQLKMLFFNPGRRSRGYPSLAINWICMMKMQQNFMTISWSMLTTKAFLRTSLLLLKKKGLAFLKVVM